MRSTATRIFALALTAVVLFLLGQENLANPLASPWDEPDRAALWKQVSDARGKKLPKTEMELLDKIYQSAISDGTESGDAEALRAILRKIIVESRINAPFEPFAFQKFDEEYENFPPRVKPLADAIGALWFEYYFRQNRWRFNQRSQTTVVDEKDFETWDLRRVLREIDGRFQKALADPASLQKTPVGPYGKLLPAGGISDKHRPTLYDIVANEAIGFYSLGEQIVRRQHALDLSSDGGVFAGAKDFIKQDFSGGEAQPFLFKAAQLYQSLLKFHEKDADQTAFLDADLNRIAFAHNHATGDGKKALYRAALQRYADAHVQHELSSKALAMLATSYHADREYVKAHELATQGMNRFKNSRGGKMCSNLINTIEAQELSIESETVWNEATSKFELSYRNIEKVHFRIVECDFKIFDRYNGGSQLRLSPEEYAKLFAQQSVKEWSVDLKATDDYQMASKQLEIPLDFKSGSYLLLASGKETDLGSLPFLMHHHFWRSNLAHVNSTKSRSLAIEGRVYDAVSGAPIAGASVSLKSWPRNRNLKANARQRGSVVTDENGFYSFAGDAKLELHKLVITHNDQTLGVFDQDYRSPPKKYLDLYESARFFTDRSIYRPGQTIHFKAVCVSSDRDNQKYSTAPAGQKVIVRLFDRNRQEVEMLTLITNDFGSVSGSFTAPRGATGVMTLETDSSPYGGNTQIRVEEYKRPKFRVALDKPETTFGLNQAVTLTGTATAYNGAAIDSAKVDYRVVRSVQYPDWWYGRCWWMPPNRGAREEITNGQIETGADGKFEIQFTAKPDASVDRAGDPVFTYRVFADVTDSNGETRSDDIRVRVGYTSLQAALTHKSWLTSDAPVTLDVLTETLDSVPQTAVGKLKIYALTPPEKVAQAPLSGRRSQFSPRADDELEPDLSKFTQWPLGELRTEKEITTGDDGKATTDVKLPVGAWKAVFESTDPAGAKFIAEAAFLVIDPAADKFEIALPDYFAVETKSVQPGETFSAVWGTGYETATAHIEFFHRNELVKSFWTEPGKTLQKIEFPIQEQHRGGINVVVTFLRENRFYTHTHRVKVPWDNKKLTVKWEHFVSKLQPGGRETWTAVVSGPDVEMTAIEMVAAMYDSSLDQFAPHQWSASLGQFYNDNLNRSRNFANTLRRFQTDRGLPRWPNKAVPRGYRSFADYLLLGRIYRDQDRPVQRGLRVMGGGMGGGGGVFGGVATVSRFGLAESDCMPAPMMAGTAMAEVNGDTDESGSQDKSALKSGESTANDVPVAIRKNLQETAFFFPVLTSDEDGRVRIEFEIPEALTSWKFMGMAHDKELRTGLLIDEMTTSKDLMVQPNPPRFLREDDEVYFPVKIINQSDQVQSGKVELTLKDAMTDEDVDEPFANAQRSQTFTLQAKESKSVLFRLKVPDFVGALTWRAVASTDKLSDGEEGLLPVLSRRILVTESLSLPIRGNQSRDFSFDALDKIANSDSLRSESLTLQMTSNPSWYAVMALPYLMEYPHQCSEQTFNRLYANALGARIVRSNPRIKTIFQQWAGTDALKSPLEKNDDLRNAMIAESPWLIDGKDESQARRNVGLLFDENTLTNQITSAQKRLREMQSPDGSWPWFPGGRANDYLTLYITTGYGRLRKLGVEIDVQPAVSAVAHLDKWLKKKHDEVIRLNRADEPNIDSTIALYLYGRTFFMNDTPVSDQHRPAFDYFVAQAKSHWSNLSSRQSQAHVALGLHRLQDPKTPAAIMKSLTERSLSDDEMGMFWREGQDRWFWYQAPIETQALMIEAYDEILSDAKRVEECKIWLLKQKQTQAWKTTKSTADAVYALLLRGTDRLASSKLVDVSIGGVAIKPDKVEAGTGFFEERFSGGEIKQELKEIRVAKSDDGIAWGSVHWRYLENVSKIEPYEGTPLTLKKSLYVKKNTAEGPVISPVEGAVSVGDELVTRIEIRVDRDMEFVHLKDYRGSGTEPVNVLSQYKSQDGVWYYESTRDTASHFFIDYLPRGTYVFEYSNRVQLKGNYQTGIAEVQSMYAPEFGGHSNSVAIEVK